MKLILNKGCFIICITLFLSIGCRSQEKITLYSKTLFNPIPEISLNEYKSVQDRNTSYQNPKLALGISIAGGGSRAQYYGTGVLLGLEELSYLGNPQKNFLNEIDYFSSVSGGGYAAGYYLTILSNILMKSSQSFKDFYFNKNQMYPEWVVKSANAKLILKNNKNEKGFKYTMVERLDYEVLQYSKNIRNSNKLHNQMKLSDFFISKNELKEPRLPMFITNATIYNNAERFPFMPHIISTLKLNKSLPPNKATIPLNSDEINNGYDLPLSYAITASSAFPGVLPKVKFGIKDNKKVLTLIDGGVVDNLGYTSLLEVLNADKKVDNINKRALIVDCSGQGKIGQLNKDEKIGLFSLATTTSLFTVQTKYLYHEQAIEDLKKRYDIPLENSHIIGFSTIRDYLKNTHKDSQYEKMVDDLEKSDDENKVWFRFYLQFKKSLIDRVGKGSFVQDGNGEVILSSMSFEKFNEFTPSDVLILYEYASQVETKLKTYPDEREMLILAGRYTVYLERDKIKALLKI